MTSGPKADATRLARLKKPNIWPRSSSGVSRIMKTRSAVHTQPSAAPIAGAASQTVQGFADRRRDQRQQLRTRAGTASSTARGPTVPSTRPVVSAAIAAPTTDTAITTFFSVSEKPPSRVM